MDQDNKPQVEQPKGSATKRHMKKHKKKYAATGIVAALLVAALELLPGLQELVKLKIDQAIMEIKDAGR